MAIIRYNIIRFPGSNCDYDSFHIPEIRGSEVEFVWHKETSLKNPDVVFIPGGFSYGDYLRCGAIARFSPIINAIIRFAEKGGVIIGVCNGFQILTECGLLPGALLMNKNLRFICSHQFITPVNIETPFTGSMDKKDVLDIPIAHKEGNFYADEDTLKEMEDNSQIVFKYCDKEGNIHSESNPNGSIMNIAGICSKNKRVLGMMPHPERAAEDVVTSRDGSKIFESLELFFANL